VKVIVDMETHFLHKRTKALTAMVEQYKQDINRLERDVENLRLLVADLYKEKAALKMELEALRKKGREE